MPFIRQPTAHYLMSTHVPSGVRAERKRGQTRNIEVLRARLCYTFPAPAKGNNAPAFPPTAPPALCRRSLKALQHFPISFRSFPILGTDPAR